MSHSSRKDNPQISLRKKPKQSRSSELVNTIMTAAIQVLEKEGIARFTTSRVAERAGVSIGSLYQYFPNKASILFHLQHAEWQQTADLICRILGNETQPPPSRLRTLVHTFIDSECEEAALRTALNDAAPFYRDDPKAQEAKHAGQLAFNAFITELLPKASTATQTLACELLSTTLGAAGKSFSEQARTDTEIAAYADAMSDMFCAYLKKLADAAKP